MSDDGGEREPDVKLKMTETISEERITSVHSDQMVGCVLEVTKSFTSLNKTIKTQPNYLGPDKFIQDVNLRGIPQPRRVLIDHESLNVVDEMDQWGSYDFSLGEFAECGLEIASN